MPVFGLRYELVGHDDPSHGVVPAHERFESCHRAGLAFDLGLIHELKLMAIECLAKARFGHFELKLRSALADDTHGVVPSARGKQPSHSRLQKWLGEYSGDIQAVLGGRAPRR